MPTLRIHLLGDFHLMLDDQVITSVIPPRVQSLLAYLVLHSQIPQSRQRVAFLFWPDSTEDQARTNLRQALHLLRQAFPDPNHFFHSDGQTVQWLSDSPFTLDVAEFEKAIAQASTLDALRQAVSLYHGELLSGCFDEWMLSERERLRQKFVEALERLILLLEGERDYRSAIRYGEYLLRSDPLREETYRLLIRLHGISGNRAEALRIYQTCVSVLTRELDVEPSAETRAVFEQSHTETRSVLPAVTPSQRRTHNLPKYLTSFVGRKDELEILKQFFPSSNNSKTRLLTLTGTGGCGKTRLALQLANELMSMFGDGVWFIDLTPLTDPTLIPHTIASVLGVQEQSDRSLMDTLTIYLQSKELLLIFDNCEHLVNACTQVIEALLRACPFLQILATSREKLNIMGDVVWRVPSLSLPHPTDLTLSTLARSDAIKLFVERACSALPTFALNAVNAQSVVQICQRLDGIPLAIELAAARIAILTPNQITTRLDHIFQLLTQGSYSTLSRHQTLRATMDWSFALLSAKEQILFRRLAVFVSGFTLDTVEAICAEPEPGNLAVVEILDLLSKLADKSLVNLSDWEQSEQARYRLLEPIWQYANEKLVESGEVESLSSRHLEFFLKLAEEVEPKLKGEAQGIWLERLEVEHNNLRAALQWSVKEGGNAGLGLRLASALVDFWLVRGEYTEGRRWLEVALKASDDTSTPWRAKALQGAGWLALFQGDLAAARLLLEDGLIILRELGDKPGIAYSLLRLGGTATVQCDLAAARSFLEDSLVILREIGNKPGIANVLYYQGHLAHAQGEWAAARVLLDESLLILRELGDKQGIALALQDLGMVIAELGDCTLGRSILEESMAIGRELGSRFDASRTAWALGKVAHREGNYALAKSWYAEFATIVKAMGTRLGMLYLLTACARLAASESQFERMVRLLAAAEHLSDAMGAPIVPVERIEHERLALVARVELGEDTYAKAWAQGQAMKIEEAIDYATKVEEP